MTEPQEPWWVDVLGDNVDLPLTAFDVADPNGRWEFLWRLSEIDEAGLFTATSHVWTSLAPPRATRCGLMASRVGLSGAGRKALYAVLKRFIEVFNEETDPPDMPDAKDFPSAAEWHAAVSTHFAVGDAAISRVIGRWSAVLNGEDPDAAPALQPEAQVIVGPWKPVTAPVKNARERAARRRGLPDIVCEADLLSELASAFERAISRTQFGIPPGEIARYFSAFAHAAGLMAPDARRDYPVYKAIHAPDEMLAACNADDLYCFARTLVEPLHLHAGENLFPGAVVSGALAAACERARELAEQYAQRPLLVVGAEGGSISLLRKMEAGQRSYRVETKEGLFGSRHRAAWGDLSDALKALDRYPWPQLCALKIDRRFAFIISQRLYEKVGFESEDWDRWLSALEGETCG